MDLRLSEDILHFYENSRMLAILIIAIYALAAICAVRELMNSRTAQGSIAWLLSLIILPFPTAFLYLIFGWKFLGDYAELQTFSGRKNRAQRVREMGIADEITSSEWPVLSNITQMPFLSGNKSELLIDGEATFKSIFEGIIAAKTSILVQFYTIKNDSLGKKLAQILVEKANAGLNVMVLYDDIGSSGLSKNYISLLKQAGVEVNAFNQRHKFLRIYGPMRINFRNHRKIVVVDNETAWVGGHNVSNDYLGKNPKFGDWRDTHICVCGPAALACALVFREDWEWATGEKLKLEPPKTKATKGDEAVLVMPTGPADMLEDCAIAFSEVISRARKRLWIVSPYFVPGIDVQTALYAAALRGVEIRILLPKKADHMMVWLASYAHADQMLDHGIPIYRYNKGFLHQKIILVDDEIAGVGTVNFDNRSFSINFEVTLWFTHKRMISSIEKMLINDFSNSNKTTTYELETRPLWFRVAAQIARLFSPVL